MKSYIFGKLKLDYHNLMVGYFDQNYLAKHVLKGRDSEQARQIKVLERVKDLSHKGDLTAAYLLIENFIHGRPQTHFSQWLEKTRARIYAEETLGVVKQQANLYMQ